MAYSLLGDPSLVPAPYGAKPVPLPPASSAPGISSLLRPPTTPAVSSRSWLTRAPESTKSTPIGVGADGQPSQYFDTARTQPMSYLNGQVSQPVAPLAAWGPSRVGLPSAADQAEQSPPRSVVDDLPAIPDASSPNFRAESQHYNMALGRAQLADNAKSREASQLTHLAQITALGDKMKREQAAIAAAHKALVGGTDPVEAYLGSGGSESATIGALRIREGQGAPSRMTFSSQGDLEQRYPGSKYDYKFVSDPATGEVTTTGISPRAPAQPQPNRFMDSLNESLGKQVSSVIEKVPDYQSTLEQVQRGRAALAAGATTGGLANAKLAFAKTANGLFGSNIFTTAQTELAKTTFADMALTAASRMRGQGQITENERKMLGDTVAQIGNSPEAINYLMNYMEAAAQRSLGKASALQKLRDSSEVDSAKYSSILTGWERENPINLEAVGAVPKGKVSRAESILGKHGMK